MHRIASKCVELVKNKCGKYVPIHQCIQIRADVKNRWLLKSHDVNTFTKRTQCKLSWTGKSTANLPC